VDKKPLTQPRPFTLRSDTRASLRRSHGGATEAGSSGERPFKAQPVKRRKILDGPVSAVWLVARHAGVPAVGSRSSQQQAFGQNLPSA
jgi:hypothetical protein